MVQLESSFGENGVASHYMTQKSEGFAWPLGVGVTPVWTLDWLAKKVKLGTNLRMNHALDQY